MIYILKRYAWKSFRIKICEWNVRSISNVIYIFSPRLKIDTPTWLKKREREIFALTNCRPFPGKPARRFTLRGIMIGYRLPQTYLTRMQFHSAAVFPQPSTATNGGLRCRRKGFLFPWNYEGERERERDLMHRLLFNDEKNFVRFSRMVKSLRAYLIRSSIIYNREDAKKMQSRE